MFPRMTTVGIEVLTICTRAHAKMFEGRTRANSGGSSLRTAARTRHGDSARFWCGSVISFWDSHPFETTRVPAFRYLRCGPMSLALSPEVVPPHLLQHGAQSRAFKRDGGKVRSQRLAHPPQAGLFPNLGRGEAVEVQKSAHVARRRAAE